jgi:hypothetical protein
MGNMRRRRLVQPKKESPVTTPFPRPPTHDPRIHDPVHGNTPMRVSPFSLLRQGFLPATSCPPTSPNQRCPARLHPHLHGCAALPCLRRRLPGPVRQHAMRRRHPHRHLAESAPPRRHCSVPFTAPLPATSPLRSRCRRLERHGSFFRHLETIPYSAQEAPLKSNCLHRPSLCINQIQELYARASVLLKASEL